MADLIVIHINTFIFIYLMRLKEFPISSEINFPLASRPSCPIVWVSCLGPGLYVLQVGGRRTACETGHGRILGNRRPMPSTPRSEHAAMEKAMNGCSNLQESGYSQRDSRVRRHEGSGAHPDGASGSGRPARRLSGRLSFRIAEPGCGRARTRRNHAGGRCA